MGAVMGPGPTSSSWAGPWGPHKGAQGWGCLAGGVSGGWRAWAVPRWGTANGGCGESWALLAASWGWQDPWGGCVGGAVQLWRGREMCSLPRSASSARAPAGFISSRWVPQMDRFKSRTTESSRVPAHGAVAVTHGQQCHSQRRARHGQRPRHCWRAGTTSQQHPGCLPGTTATTDQAVTVTTGANLGKSTACIPPRCLSCLSCPFPKSRAARGARSPAQGLSPTPPCCCTAIRRGPAEQAGKQDSTGKETTAIAQGDCARGPAPGGVQGGAPRLFLEWY